MKRRILIIMIFIILFLLIVVYFFIGNYFYNMALNPNTSKTFVLGEIEETEEQKINRISNIKWLEDNSKDVYIVSEKDNLKLHAYEILKKSNNWAIIVHGYMSQGSEMILQAKQFWERNFNVLILDLRGHGKSEGDYIGMGWHDRLDVINWVNYLIQKNNDCKILLYGVSMGAATVMMATGEKLPNNIKLAIEDCGYSSIWEEFKMQLKTLFNLPAFPVLNAASSVCKIRAGYGIKDGSSIEQLKNSKTPTLFIHGNKDKFVPFEMLEPIYESANCEKQKLVIDGAAHAQASTVNLELYWKTIDGFIEKYLK